MVNFVGTVKELAASQNVDYAVAAGLVKFLETKGIAKKTGNRPNPSGGRGKPSSIYTIPLSLTVTLEEVTTKESAPYELPAVSELPEEIDMSEVSAYMPAAA